MVHSTAIVSAEAEIDPSAEVGAYAIIEGPVKIGAGCKVAAHAHVLGDTVLGEGTTIGRGAVIGDAPQDLSFVPGTPSGVRIGRDNIIREHVTIHRGSKEGSYTIVGEKNFLMAGAHLGHDVHLGNHNVLANAALLGGHVQMGDRNFVGGGSVFHQFVRVGDLCVFQGVSGFSKDVPPFCGGHLINHIFGLNVIGMRRQGLTKEERASVKTFFNLLYRSGKNLSQALAAARELPWLEPAARMLAFCEAPSKKGICAFGSASED